MTFDAVLLVSYGGPRGPEDVLPFLRNATRGRGVPEERLLDVAAHYRLFGGVSPLNARNAELAAALSAELQRRGIEAPVAVGNRTWSPYVADVLAELADAGASRVLCVITSGYASYSGCRQYREDLAGAESGLDLALIGPYAETDGFVTANADALVAALRRTEDPATAKVVFVTHSIPVAMEEVSGPGPDELRYSGQTRRVAARVADLAAVELGFSPAWELAYCSRSGGPRVPWLEPDIDDRLAELAGEGVREAVVAPIGFINDHMEVVYDLDTRAAATASELGLGFVRAATVGTHPAFVGMLADAIQRRFAGEPPKGDPGSVADPAARLLGGVPTCSTQCCRSGRPGGPTLPAACGTHD